jgi:hypothetical protein
MFLAYCCFNVGVVESLARGELDSGDPTPDFKKARDFATRAVMMISPFRRSAMPTKSSLQQTHQQWRF